MSNFTNYARLNVPAFRAWLSREGVSKHHLEEAHGVPRLYWSRWAKGTRIAPATQRRLVEEVGLPSNALVVEANHA